MNAPDVSASRDPRVVIGIVLALLGISTLFFTRTDDGVERGPELELRAPGDLQLPDATIFVDHLGRTFDMDQLRGRIVVMHVWATWSEPSMASLWTFEALARRLDPNRFALVMAAVERADVVERFVRDHDLPLTFLSVKGRVPLPFTRSRIPVTFILDREGRVRAEHVGAADWSGDRVVQTLQTLADD